MVLVTLSLHGFGDLEGHICREFSWNTRCIGDLCFHLLNESYGLSSLLRDPFIAPLSQLRLESLRAALMYLRSKLGSSILPSSDPGAKVRILCLEFGGIALETPTSVELKMEQIS